MRRRRRLTSHERNVQAIGVLLFVALVLGLGLYAANQRRQCEPLFGSVEVCVKRGALTSSPSRATSYGVAPNSSPPAATAAARAVPRDVVEACDEKPLSVTGGRVGVPASGAEMAACEQPFLEAK